MTDTGPFHGWPLNTATVSVCVAGQVFSEALGSPPEGNGLRYTAVRGGMSFTPDPVP